MRYRVEYKDSPESIAERLTGNPRRFEELIAANPSVRRKIAAKDMVTGRVITTFLDKDFNTGMLLNVPVSWNEMIKDRLKDQSRRGTVGGLLDDIGDELGLNDEYTGPPATTIEGDDGGGGAGGGVAHQAALGAACAGLANHGAEDKKAGRPPNASAWGDLSTWSSNDQVYLQACYQQAYDAAKGPEAAPPTTAACKEAGGDCSGDGDCCGGMTCQNSKCAAKVEESKGFPWWIVAVGAAAALAVGVVVSQDDKKKKQRAAA